MTFGHAVKTVLTAKYSDFSGRATRSEYWWYHLFFVGCLTALFIPIVAGVASTPTGEDPTGASQALTIGGLIALGVLFLATIVPGVAVTVRRLHDVGMSGWMYLVGFIPYLGGLFLLVAACLDSKPTNQWGPNPKHTNPPAPGADGQSHPELAWQAASPGDPALPPAGWYSDPRGFAPLRYWDGGAWTEHVSG